MANIFSLFPIFLSAVFASNSVPEIVHKMNSLSFTFATPAEEKSFNTSGAYRNCIPSGIKLDSSGTIFISVPRIRTGVYSTLNTLVNSNNNIGLLQPFPNIAENKIGDPDALQSVVGFEIDLDDNIWVLDQGSVNSVPLANSAKVKVYTKTGTVKHIFQLNNYIHASTSYLNDLVLDVSGQYVYITDSGTPNSAIIVINVKTGTIYRALENDPSVLPDPSLWITVNGQRFSSELPFQAGVDGVALSCNRETLYYAPLTSRYLYAIKTQYLKTPSADISSKVIKLGHKYTAGGGLVSSENGRLYLSGVELNTVFLQTNIKADAANFKFNLFQPIIYDSRLLWPESFGFYNAKKTLFAISNQYQNFMTNNIDFDNPINGDANFYIWSVYVNDQSYLKGCLNNDVESDDNTFPAWAIVLVVIVVLVVVAIIACAIRNYILAKKKRQTFL